VISSVDRFDQQIRLLNATSNKLTSGATLNSASYVFREVANFRSFPLKMDILSVDRSKFPHCETYMHDS